MSVYVCAHVSELGCKVLHSQSKKNYITFSAALNETFKPLVKSLKYSPVRLTSVMILISRSTLTFVYHNSL